MDEKSLRILRDFSKRIETIGSNKEDEIFIRCLVAAVMDDCPLPLVEKVARVVRDYRMKELRDAAESN